jgi:hypothetical protein
MRKKVILIIAIALSMTLGNCSTSKLSQTNCNENDLFKKGFMLKVGNVEKYTYGVGNRKDFITGLEFISKYCHVSYNEMANFYNNYDNLESFKKDKEEWLKWYEENKCNNLQFK